MSMLFLSVSEKAWRFHAAVWILLLRVRLSTPLPALSCILALHPSMLGIGMFASGPCLHALSAEAHAILLSMYTEFASLPAAFSQMLLA